MAFATVDLALQQARPNAYKVNSIELKRKLCNALIVDIWNAYVVTFRLWGTFCCINKIFLHLAQALRALSKGTDAKHKYMQQIEK